MKMRRPYKGQIHNWSICFTSPDPYKPINVHEFKIVGHLPNDPGKKIQTSKVLHFDFEIWRVKTENAVYDIPREKIDPDFNGFLKLNKIRLEEYQDKLMGRNK